MPARNDTLLYATQVRLTKVQRDYLAALCEAEDLAMSAAIRRCIDQVIDQLPPVDGITRLVQVEGREVEQPVTVRRLLEASETDVDWLGEVLARASLHEVD
jgi:hypothetical protein